MGYRIEYDGRAGKYEIRSRSPWRFPLLLSCAVGLFLLATFPFWEEGAEYIREALVPGENEVTTAALKNLTARLRQGDSLRDAVTAFCQDVIHGVLPAN